MSGFSCAGLCNLGSFSSHDRALVNKVDHAYNVPRHSNYTLLQPFRHLGTTKATEREIKKEEEYVWISHMTLLAFYLVMEHSITSIG